MSRQTTSAVHWLSSEIKRDPACNSAHILPEYCKRSVEGISVDIDGLVGHALTFQSCENAVDCGRGHIDGCEAPSSVESDSRRTPELRRIGEEAEPDTLQPITRYHQPLASCNAFYRNQYVVRQAGNKNISIKLYSGSFPLVQGKVARASPPRPAIVGEFHCRYAMVRQYFGAQGFHYPAPIGAGLKWRIAEGVAWIFRILNFECHGDILGVNPLTKCYLAKMHRRTGTRLGRNLRIEARAGFKQPVKRRADALLPLPDVLPQIFSCFPQVREEVGASCMSHIHEVQHCLPRRQSVTHGAVWMQAVHSGWLEEVEYSAHAWHRCRSGRLLADNPDELRET